MCPHLKLDFSKGLKEFDESIANVSSVVKYIKSSPQIYSTSKSCVQFENVTRKSHVCLDVLTRCNSTYFMLDNIIKF